MDTDAIVRRFRNERQILASFEHPNIAGLLDGGTTADGLPYFAMEFVEGQPIDDYADAHQLDTSSRLHLFRKVCAAVQHAHQNLVIHRDIKPANVLVTADGTPKLLDFGIAKLLNPELGGATLAPTLAGFQLMTPEYASPEQVRGDPVTTATDIYSLGVLLYELLTGRRPYRLTSRTPDEIARVVCNSVPVRPSTAVTQLADLSASDARTGATAVTMAEPHTIGGERRRSPDERLRRRLEGDIDNIVLKALNKEPARRYASVDQLSEDIQRHLNGLPVIARKDTLRYRTSKFVRRNRAAVIGGAAVFIALVAGMIGTAWQARRAQIERGRAEQRFNDVRQLANSFLFEVHDAIRDLPGATPARQLMVSKGLEYLDKLSRDSSGQAGLQRELAGAYLRVGDVQGRPFNANLGDSAGALASYQKSAALYESIAHASPDDASLKRELSTAYLRLSEMLAATGDTKKALESARQALELQQAVTGPSAPPEARRELAASHSRVGDLLSSTGDTKGALEQRRVALALMEPVAAVAPTDVANIRQLGVAYQKLGNTLGNPNYPNVGDPQGALEQLEKSSAVFRNGVAAYPNNALFRRNMGIAESNISDILYALKRPDDSLARQQKALSIFKELASADPSNVTARNDIAISESKLGEMLDANGRTAEALAPFERALATHQGLSAADPQNSTFRGEVASDHNRLATIQAKLGLRAPALANHDRAVAISGELAAANPANVELRMALALALAGRGDAYVQLAPRGQARAADLTTAERDYAEAVRMLEKLEQEKAIEGSDLATLENGRKELARIRQELTTLPRLP
jgi:non-specific serine/threonine protein kinase/serine/threonine-protein kinase